MRCLHNARILCPLRADLHYCSLQSHHLYFFLSYLRKHSLYFTKYPKTQRKGHILSAQRIPDNGPKRGKGEKGRGRKERNYIYKT